MTLDKQTLNVARNTTRIVHSFIAFRKRKIPWTKTILFKTCAVIDRNNSHWQKQQSQQKTTSLNPLPLKKKFCLFCTYVFFTTYTMLTRWKLVDRVYYNYTMFSIWLLCLQFDTIFRVFFVFPTILKSSPVWITLSGPMTRCMSNL